MSHIPACSPAFLSRRLGLLALSLLALLVASGCTAFARAVKEGDEFTTQRQWAQAEAAYQRALAVEPEDSEARVKLRAMRQQWSAEVLEQAKGVHGQGDLAGATPLLVRALELDEGNEEVRELLVQTLDARVEVGLKALKEERLQDARSELDAVLAVDAGHAAAKRGVDGVRMAWARRWFNTAQRLEQEGKPGNALVAYVRADQERVGATPARERAAAVRRQLQDEIAFLVVAGPVEDKAQAPDVAQRLGPGRLSALLPQEVPIRVVTEEPPPGRVGVRLGLSLERVVPVKTVEASQRAQRYVVTNKAVPNPRRAELEEELGEEERKLEDVDRRQEAALLEYLRKQAELEQAREVAERCRERERKLCRDALVACGRAASQSNSGRVPSECNPAQCNPQCAGEDGAVGQRVSGSAELERRLRAAREASEAQRLEVRRARDVWYREPPTVEEPLYGEYPYDVELHRLAVMASVTEKLVDLNKAGAVPSPHTEDYAAVHEDVAHKGYEKVGVLADPVQLRSEVELRVEAGDKAMEAIAERVKARFDVYRQQRVEDARRGMVRPSAEDVVETAVRALLLTADDPPQDILLPLSRARGLENPEALFGR